MRILPRFLLVLAVISSATLFAAEPVIPEKKPPQLPAAFTEKIFPKVEFREAPLSDCLAWLKKQGLPVELDPKSATPASKVLLTLSLKDVPAKETLYYFVHLSNATYEVANGKVVVFLKDLESMQALVPVSFFGGAEAAAKPQEFFELRGVVFSDGASATYDIKSETLNVKVSSKEFDKVKKILEDFYKKK